jgi:hypothetical protein
MVSINRSARGSRGDLCVVPIFDKIVVINHLADISEADASAFLSQIPVIWGSTNVKMAV